MRLRFPAVAAAFQMEVKSKDTRVSRFRFLSLLQFLVDEVLLYYNVKVMQLIAADFFILYYCMCLLWYDNSN